MTQRNNMCNLLITALGIYSFFISPSHGSVKYVYQNSTVPTDGSVQSDNYPGVYPRNLNVTWVFETTRGHWGVYFRDFDLSRHEDFTDGGDRLRLQSARDGSVMTYTYTSATESYISRGPRLMINFVTDNKIDDASVRGFDLQIVYGQTESVVRLKLHEAAQRKARGGENEGPPATLIASIVISALVFAGLAIIGVLKLRAARKVKGEGDRDVFGVRRGSGVRHSRRGSSASPPQTPDGTDGQGPQAPARQGSVQNGRLGWMARAERNNSLSTTRRNQSFESSEHPTCATSAPHSHHTNHYSNYAGPGSTPEPHRPYTTHLHQPTASGDDSESPNSAHGIQTKEVERVFECVSERVGKCRDTSHSFRFVCPKAAEALGERNTRAEKLARAHAPGLKERGSEETSQKFCFESEDEDLDDSVSSNGPPPYESLLESFVPNSACADVVCYGNVLDAQPCPCGVRSENGSSDGYINASSNAHDIAVLTTGREIQYASDLSLDLSASAADCQASSKLSIPKCVVSDHSSSPDTVHRELPVSNSKGRPISAEHHLEAAQTQICFVDGYAYIIPQPDDEPGGGLRPVTQEHLQRHKSARCRLSAVPDAVRASQLANELGYIDMFTGSAPHAASPRVDNIYTNAVPNSPVERANIAV